jgi:hypothetical protein
MTYNLPTLSSLNRQNGLPPIRRRMPRRESDAQAVCTHDVRVFAGGRCPVCYRASIRNYGRMVRRRGVQQPRVRPPPHIRLPQIRIPRPPPTPRSTPIATLVLPGSKIYGSAGESCIICMNSYESDRVCQQLPCGHRFHTWCFSKWYIKKRNCPLCREVFN